MSAAPGRGREEGEGAEGPTRARRAGGGVAGGKGGSAAECELGRECREIKSWERERERERES